jgi:hypothetical protein
MSESIGEVDGCDVGRVGFWLIGSLIGWLSFPAAVAVAPFAISGELGNDRE